MRQWILTGALTAGEQLPVEAELAEQFGTSRSTIREALRLLAADNLVVTRAGAGGGTSVARPVPDRISHLLDSNLSLLVWSDELTPEDVIATREILEIPVASLAAANRDEDQLDRLRKLLPERPGEMDPDALHQIDREFHNVLFEASGNRLLPLLCAPLSGVLERGFQRSRMAPDFWEAVVQEHRAIAAAVEARDTEGAADRMRDHLRSVREGYRLMDVAHRRDQPTG
ncbi:FadR/GntR family transcriptional regulator [Thermocatellispora tengchongensis]